MPECIIPCCDLWPPGSLTKTKMLAYKTLAEQQKIARLSVVYSRDSRHTIIEYMSSLPHAWIKDQLKEKANELLIGQQSTQIKMEV